jgi:hypothetical protein
MAGLLSSQIQTIPAPTCTAPEWAVTLMAPSSYDCRGAIAATCYPLRLSRSVMSRLWGKGVHRCVCS